MCYEASENWVAKENVPRVVQPIRKYTVAIMLTYGRGKPELTND